MINSDFVKVLGQLYDNLPVTEVNWAITGSLSFKLHGMDVIVHDIDIQTDKAGSYEIETRFAPHVAQNVTFSSSEKIRSHFGELNIEGIKVEIMGDIQNQLSDSTWTSPADITLHRKFIDYDGMLLPVMSLEYECEAYDRLGRKERAKQIREFLTGI